MRIVKAALSFLTLIILLQSSIFAQNSSKVDVYFSDIQSGNTKLTGSVTIAFEPVFLGYPYAKAKWENLKITSIKYRGKLFSESSTEFTLNNLGEYIRIPYQVKDKSKQINATLDISYYPNDISAMLGFDFNVERLVGISDSYGSEEADKWFKDYKNSNGLSDNDVWKTALLSNAEITSLSGSIGQEIAMKLDRWFREEGKKASEGEAKSWISKANLSYGSNQVNTVRKGLEHIEKAKDAAIKSGNARLYEQANSLENKIANKISELKTKEFNRQMAAKKAELDRKNSYSSYGTTPRYQTYEQRMKQVEQNWNNSFNQLASILSSGSGYNAEREARRSAKFRAEIEESRRKAQRFDAFLTNWDALAKVFMNVFTEMDENTAVIMDQSDYGYGSNYSPKRSRRDFRKYISSQRLFRRGYADRVYGQGQLRYLNNIGRNLSLEENLRIAEENNLENIYATWIGISVDLKNLPDTYEVDLRTSEATIPITLLDRVPGNEAFKAIEQGVNFKRLQIDKENIILKWDDSACYMSNGSRVCPNVRGYTKDYYVDGQMLFFAFSTEKKALKRLVRKIYLDLNTIASVNSKEISDIDITPLQETYEEYRRETRAVEREYQKNLEYAYELFDEGEYIQARNSIVSAANFAKSTSFLEIPDKAREIYKQSVIKQTEYEEHLKNAETEKEEGNNVTALDFYKKAYSLRPNVEEVQEEINRITELLENKRKAYEARLDSIAAGENMELKEASKIARKLRNSKAKSAKDLNDIFNNRNTLSNEEIVSQLEQHIEEFPKDINGYIAYTEFLFEANINFSRIESLSEKIDEIMDIRGIGASNLGWISFLKGQYEEAFRKLEKANQALSFTDETYFKRLLTALDSTYTQTPFKLLFEEQAAKYSSMALERKIEHPSAAKLFTAVCSSEEKKKNLDFCKSSWPYATHRGVWQLILKKEKADQDLIQAISLEDVQSLVLDYQEKALLQDIANNNIEDWLVLFDNDIKSNNRLVVQPSAYKVKDEFEELHKATHRFVDVVPYRNQWLMLLSNNAEKQGGIYAISNTKGIFKEGFKKDSEKGAHVTKLSVERPLWTGFKPALFISVAFRSLDTSTINYSYNQSDFQESVKDMNRKGFYLIETKAIGDKEAVSIFLKADQTIEDYLVKSYYSAEELYKDYQENYKGSYRILNVEFHN